MAEEKPADQTAQQRTGWRPTTSTLTGAGAGVVVGQILLGLLEYFGAPPMQPWLAMALGQAATVAFGYIHPDGGRR